MMRSWSKKGYALVMAMLAIIILTIIGFGLYSSVEHLVKEIKVQETGHIRGHYATLSGLRYAGILLKTPENYFSTPAHNGEAYTVIGNELGGNLFGDIGVNSSDLIITITEWNTGASWTQDEYDVSATYSYY